MHALLSAGALHSVCVLHIIMSGNAPKLPSPSVIFVLKMLFSFLEPVSGICSQHLPSVASSGQRMQQTSNIRHCRTHFTTTSEPAVPTCSFSILETPTFFLLHISTIEPVSYYHSRWLCVTPSYYNTHCISRVFSVSPISHEWLQSSSTQHLSFQLFYHS